MQTIWKFPLAVTDTQIIEVPKHADILCAKVQRDVVCLWIKVNPDTIKEARIIRMFGTGHALDIDQNLEYIGSCQTLDENLIWHIFEEKHIPRA